MKAKSNLFVNTVAMLASGLAIGWLMGMSVSPTVQTVLGSVLTLLVSILGLIAGTNPLPTDKSPLISYLHNINLLPVGVFLLFLAIGSGTGVYVRANNLLGRSPRQLVADYGLDSTQATKARQIVFDRDMQDSSRAKASLSFLYDASSTICAMDGIALRIGLQGLNSNVVYKKMIENAPDSTLIRLRDEYCTKQ